MTDAKHVDPKEVLQAFGCEPVVIPDDPEGSAEAAGLHYVCDRVPGFHLSGTGKRIKYVDEKGVAITDPKICGRIRGLVIPPAWQEVWICRDAKGHIQATGRDARGRKQYIYHPHWEEIRNEVKFNHMVPFGKALPKIRAKVDKDMRKRELTWSKVVAVALNLLDQSLIRVGNTEYTLQNETYGLTTLLCEHVEVDGAKVEICFRAKSGKEHQVTIRDRRLARLIGECQELPGQELFQYKCEDGTLKPIGSSDVNSYLRAITKQDFTAKDFRTWGGTVNAALNLWEAGPAENAGEKKRKISTAIKAVAKRLNNTPTVCRTYYIHPGIIRAYESGLLFQQMKRLPQASKTTSLNPLEKNVLKLLSRKSAI